MSNLAYWARGAAAAERMRKLIAYRGYTGKGHPLWTKKEIGVLTTLYPTRTYAQISKTLKRRSYYAVRHKAQELGLTPKRHTWTGAEIIRLRKVYTTGTVEELSAAFPNFTRQHLTAIAQYHKFYRPKRRYSPTGHHVLDEVRQRAFDLGYSMGDLDQMARSKRYFTGAAWKDGILNLRAIRRAIDAMEGQLSVRWD